MSSWKTIYRMMNTKRSVLVQGLEAEIHAINYARTENLFDVTFSVTITDGQTPLTEEECAYAADILEERGFDERLVK